MQLRDKERIFLIIQPTGAVRDRTGDGLKGTGTAVQKLRELDLFFFIPWYL